MVGGLRSVVWAIVIAFVVLLSASAGASARCQGRYRDFARPVYDRLVVVYARQHLTCSQASRVGNAVATVYERGLPLVDYPPPPKGVPGGQGNSFQAHTRFGTFRCRMTARGSDFVNASCRRGVRFVRFSSMNHYFLHQLTCNGFLLGPDPEDVISNIQATGVGCGVADTVVSASRNPGAPFDIFTDYRASGFQCHGALVSPPSGGEGHIHFVCTSGSSSITFDHR